MVEVREMIRTCLFRRARALIGSAEMKVEVETEEKEVKAVKVLKVALAVGGRREVRICPIVAIIVSACHFFSSNHSLYFRRTGPMHNDMMTPKAQKPSQSFTKPQAVHLTSFPLSIPSASSLAASGPPINKGVCSSNRNTALIGLPGIGSDESSVIGR